MSVVIPDSIAASPHVAAIDKLADERFSDLELSALLIYLINTVPASALPYLGKQFDVMGYKGWKFADTEQKKRDLIKSAIELHRYKGTPWSIRNALKALGILDAVINEGVILLHDSSALYDGTENYGGGAWARFRVLVPGNAFPNLSATEINDILQLIYEYKNARSRLVGLGVYYNQSETISITESFSVNILP